MPKLRQFAADNQFDNPIDYHEAVYDSLIENIEEAYEQGLIDDEQANQAVLQADVDLAVRVLIEEGVNPADAEAAVLAELEEQMAEEYDDEEYDEAYEAQEAYQPEYSANNQKSAEFNQEAPNDFAAALMELLDEYEDPADGLQAIADASGYDPEDVLGLLQGEYVPDESMVDIIASCFETTQEEDMFIALHLLAAEARGEDLESEEDGEDTAGYYEDEEAEEEYNPEMEAAYSRIGELEGTIANFAAEQDLKTRLDQMIRFADGLLEDGKLSPVQFQGLFGNMPDALDNEKVAMFSSVCEANKVDAATELYAMNKCLEFAARCGNTLPSGQVVGSDFVSNEDVEAAEFAAEVSDTVKRNLSLYQEQGFLNPEKLGQ